MSRNKRDYRRLPGRKRRFIGMDAIYAGPDHLLQVKSVGMSEDYRRFYYRDIKYLHVEKTFYGLIENLIISGLLLLIGLWGFSLWQENGSPGAVPLWIIAGILAFYLLKNLINGGTCQCWIETDVQREKLNALSRIRPMKKTFKRLIPLIEMEQGRLLREDFVKVIQEPARNQSRSRQQRVSSTVFKKNYNGFWHQWLYLLLTAAGLFDIVSLYYHPLPVIVFGSLLFSTTGAFAIIAVIKQSGSKMPESIKSLSWVVLVLIISGFVIGYFEIISMTIKNVGHPGAFNDQLWYFKLYADIDPFKHPLILGIEIFYIISYLICGLTGLFLRNES